MLDGQHGRSSRVIYSVGYEGRTVDELLARVSRVGVEVLLDVRLNPVSRKPGLSKKKLAALLGEAGIEYVHEPLLGNPRDNRDGFRNGDVQAAQRRFEERLAKGSRGALLNLVERSRTAHIALMCYEANAGYCHRKVITESAQREDPTLMVVTL